MQRRAVAVYVALFLLVGAAAGGLIVTADTPEYTFDDPDEELSVDDTFQVGDQEYTVSDVTVEEVEDHGEVTTEISAVIEWEVISEMSETWSNESTVELDDREWTVLIEGEEPSEFTLREIQDREAILEEDPNADNETVEREDGEYVVVTDEEGESRLVPVDEYFDPEERTHTAGDTLEYAGETVTVAEVTADGVVVEWEAPQAESLEMGQNEIITLGETEFVAHISEDGETLTLSSDIEAFDRQTAEMETFEQRSSGLFRVLVTSLFGAVLVAALAFVPTRY